MVKIGRQLAEEAAGKDCESLSAQIEWMSDRSAEQHNAHVKAILDFCKEKNYSTQRTALVLAYCLMRLGQQGIHTCL